MRDALEALALLFVGLLYGACLATAFWLARLPDPPVQGHNGVPVYYGGLECYTAVKE